MAIFNKRIKRDSNDVWTERDKCSFVCSRYFQLLTRCDSVTHPLFIPLEAVEANSHHPPVTSTFNHCFTHHSFSYRPYCFPLTHIREFTDNFCWSLMSFNAWMMFNFQHLSPINPSSSNLSDFSVTRIYPKWRLEAESKCGFKKKCWRVSFNHSVKLIHRHVLHCQSCFEMIGCNGFNSTIPSIKSKAATTTTGYAKQKRVVMGFDWITIIMTQRR